MRIRGVVVNSNQKTDNIAQIQVSLVEEKLENVEWLYDHILSLDVNPKKYKIKKYDYEYKSLELENGSKKKIALIKLEYVAYKSKDGEVDLYNDVNPGYLYFDYLKENDSIIKIWTSEILGMEDGDLIEFGVKEDFLEIE